MNQQITVLAKAVRQACTPDRRRPLLASVLVASASVLGASPATAGPEGGQVVGGVGTITQVDTSTLIQQGTERLAIDWQSFNVGQNESVRFDQPSSSAVAMNRIFDQNASQILGALDSNGHVYLINPNGIIFGQNATINVGSLIASSLDVSLQDFMAGHPEFNANGSAGLVVNRGLITAATGGSVALLGGSVANEGVIVAHLGQVTLGAGTHAALDFDGDGLLFFRIDGNAIADAQGQAAVSNSGTIQAAGGQVLLSGRAAQNVFSSVVNNEGLISANRIENVGGVVRLVGDGAPVLTSGTIDVSGGDAVSTGGRIEVLGEKVGVVGDASLLADGATGGGTILVGGDWQGGGGVPTAAYTVVGSGAELSADALGSGDGGKVVVWADQVARVYGDISARGGAIAGDGGAVETSGKQFLDFNGTVNAGAPNGRGGVWLLDPENVTISDPNPGLPPTPGAVDDTFNITLSLGLWSPDAEVASPETIIDVNHIINALNAGTDVAVTTVVAGPGTTGELGNITVAAPIIKSADPGPGTTPELRLDAENDIFIEAEITSSAGSLDVVLRANNNVEVNAPIDVGAGTIAITVDADEVGGDGATKLTIRDPLTTDSVAPGAITLTGGLGAIQNEELIVLLDGASTATWDVNLVNSGILTAGTSTPATFVDFPKLTGGDQVDTFNFSDAGDLVAGAATFDRAVGQGGNDVFNFLVDDTDPENPVPADVTTTIEGGAGNDTLNFNGGDLSGAANGDGGNDTFHLVDANVPITGTLDGGADSDTVQGPTVASMFAVTNDHEVELTVNGLPAGEMTVTNVENALGGAGADSFNFSADLTGTISGAGENDQFMVGFDLTGAIDGGPDAGSGGDVLTLTGDGATDIDVQLTAVDADGFDGTVNVGLDGGFANVDTLLSNPAFQGTLTGIALTDATWNVDADPTYEVGTEVLAFTSFEDLTGNTGADTFNFSGTFAETATGGAGNDIFNFPVGVDVTGTVDGGAGDDQFNFTGGNLSGTGNGDADNDTFSFTAGDVTGTLNGGTGNDLFSFNGGNLSGAGNGDDDNDTFGLVSQTVAITGTLNAGVGGSDTAVGTAAANTFDVSTAGVAVVSADGQTGTMTVSQLENLTGGGAQNTFDFSANMGGTITGGAVGDIFNFDASTVTGTIVAGTGSDDFNFAGGNLSGQADGEGDGDTFDFTTGTITGTISGGAGGDQFNFSGGNLSSTANGDGDGDTFAFTTGTITGTINGGAGGDQFDFSGGDLSSTANGDGDGDTFSFTASTVTGTMNGGAGDDQFSFDGGSFSGTANGGDGDNDTFSLISQTVAITGTLNAGVGGSDTAVGTAAANTFTVNAAGTATVAATAQAGTMTVSNLENLTGGDAQNTFTFGGTANMTGTITGGAVGDTFDFDASTVSGTVNAGGGNDQFNFDGGDLSGAANGEAGDDSFFITASAPTGGLNGGVGGVDLVAGPDLASTFDITADGAVTLSVNGVPGAVTSAVEIENLTGSSQGDTFNFAGNMSGLTQGLDGADTFTFTGGIVTGVIAAGAGDDQFNFNGGGLSNTANGQADNDIFTFTAGTVSGTVNGGAGNDQFSFNGGNLSGAGNGDAGDDTFSLVSQTVAVSGTLNAGAGDNDTAVGTAAANTFTVNAAGTATVAATAQAGTMTVSELENLTGGAAQNTFTFGGTGNITNLITGGGVGDIFNFNASTVTGTVNAGGGADQFNFNGGNLSGAGNGEAGDDIFSLINQTVAITGILNAGVGGTDTAVGTAAATTFTVNAGGTAVVSADGQTGTMTVTQLENLTGGNAQNTFTFGGTGNMVGTITGGTAGDIFNFNASTVSGTVNAGAGNDQFNFAGGNLSGAGNAEGDNDTFSFTAGSVSGTLSGGVGNDQFNFNGGNLSGTGNGDGDNDTFSLISQTVAITGTLNAGVGGSDTAVGTAAANTFTVNAGGTATVAATAQTGTMTVSQLENLTGGNQPNIFTFGGTANMVGTIAGGTAADVFNFNASTVSGTVNAGAGNDQFNFNGGNLSGAGNGQGDDDTFTLGSTAVAVTGALDGGAAGSDTVVGPNAASTFAVTADGTVALSVDGAPAGALTASNIENLTGSASADTFSFSGNMSGQTLGGAGNDTFTFVAGTVSGSVLAGTGDDQFNFNGGNLSGAGSGDDDNDTFTLTSTAVAVTGTLTGGAGTDFVAGPNAASTFTVTADGTVALTVDGGPAGLTASGIENLTGNAQQDTFAFSGNISGQTSGGAGNDVFNFVAGTVTGAVDGAVGDDAFNFNGGNLSGAGTGGDGNDSFALNNASTVVGVILDAGSGAQTTGDRIVGSPNDDTFTLTGANATVSNGAGGSLSVNNVENLAGGAGADTFDIDVAFAGAVDGDAGHDVLDLTAFSSVSRDVTLLSSSADGFSGTEAAVGGGFADIDEIRAFPTFPSTANDQLRGLNTAATWSIDGSNTYTSGGNTLAFSGFDTLTGGTAADVFDVDVPFTILNVVTVVGGAGADVLDLSSLAAAESIELTFADATGFSGRSLVDPTITAFFQSIDDIRGTASGADRLTGIATSAATWSLAGTNSYAAGGSTLAFSSFENLAGGGDVDTFDVDAGFSGSIDGNAGADVLDLTGLAGARAVTLTVAGATGFSGTEASVTGGFLGIDDLRAGAAVSDTLTGLAADATFGLDGTPTYVTGGNTLAFSGFENLAGGTGADTFDVDAAFTGTLDGNGGADILDLAGVAGARAVTLTAAAATGFAGTEASVSGGFTDIDDVRAGAATTDSLTGLNGAATWGIDGTNTYVTVPGGNSLAFAGFEGLAGGTGADTFDVDVAHAGTIDGNGGADVLDLSTIATGRNVVLTAAAADGFAGTDSSVSGGFADIDDVRAGAATNDALTALNAVNTWNLGAASSYVTGGNTLAFAGFENLNGGSLVDTFNFSGAFAGVAAGGTGADVFNFLAGAFSGAAGGGDGDDTFNLSGGNVTGTATGDAGDDTFNLNDQNVAVTATLDAGTGGETAGDRVVGTAAGNTFAVAAAGNVTVAVNGAPAGELKVANVENLIGGTGDDTFAFSGTGNVTGSATGGGGVDTFDLDVAITGRLDGGAGADVLDLAGISTARNAVLTAAGADGFSGTEAAVGGGFAGIDDVRAGSATTDALTGLDAVSTWSLDGTNTYTTGGNTLAFAGFETLNGGTQVDTFDVTAASIGGTLNAGGGDDRFNVTANAAAAMNGGAGIDTFVLANGVTAGGIVDGGAGSDVLDLSAYASARDVAITAADAEGFDGTEASVTQGFRNIDDVRGSAQAADRLRGPASAAAWTLSGAGNTLVTGGQTLSFTSFSNFTGGSAADAFNLSGTHAGPIDIAGGGGTDSATITGALTVGSLTLGEVESVTSGSAAGVINAASGALTINGATGGIGTQNQALLTNVATLAVNGAGTRVNVDEANGFTVSGLAATNAPVQIRSLGAGDVNVNNLSTTNGSVTVQLLGAGNLTANTVTTTGGGVTLRLLPAGTATVTNVTAANGDVSIEGARTATVNNVSTTGSGNIRVTAGGAVTATGLTSADDLVVRLTGAGDAILNGLATRDGGDILVQLDAAGNIILAGAVNAGAFDNPSSGDVTLRAASGSIVNQGAPFSGPPISGSNATLTAGGTGVIGNREPISQVKLDIAKDGLITLQGLDATIDNVRLTEVDDVLVLNGTVSFNLIAAAAITGTTTQSAVQDTAAIDWAGLDPNIAIVDCLQPCVRLPADQAEGEEELAKVREASKLLLIRTRDGWKMIPVFPLETTAAVR